MGEVARSGAALTVLVVAAGLTVPNVGDEGALPDALPLLVAHLVEVERVLDPDGSSCLYSVAGELFFASDQELIESFHYTEDPPNVVIDFSRAHLWDASAVAALDAIERHYRRHDVALEITGLNHRSAKLHDELSGQLAEAH